MINCSGAGYDLRRQAPPVLAGLLAAGRARPDELGLGLDVADDGAAARRRGRAPRSGSSRRRLRKGVEWEAIGITEIRDHSGAVAPQDRRAPAKPRSCRCRPSCAPPSRGAPTEWEAA